MIERLIKFLCLLLLVIPGIARAQQYPVFTQYYFNELVINPAFAGSHIQFSASSMYRNQWVNFPGSPKTMTFTAHTSILKGRMGLGVLVNRDEIGSYKNHNVYFQYAYRLRFPKSTLSMGLQAGFNLLGSDFSGLDLQHPEDAAFSQYVNSIKPNFGAGIYFNKKNYFIGLSVPFLINNSVAVVGTDGSGASNSIFEARYYLLRSGVILPLSKNLKFNPSILIRTQEGQAVSMDLNAAFIIQDVCSPGVSLRSGDSFITFIDLKLSEKFHFAYSYDWTQSRLNYFSNGTHEFMLNYRAKFSSVHKNLECPKLYDYR
jgi:type IX secretion system PorP/SprF family membrane protein